MYTKINLDELVALAAELKKDKDIIMSSLEKWREYLKTIVDAGYMAGAIEEAVFASYSKVLATAKGFEATEERLAAKVKEIEEKTRDIEETESEKERNVYEMDPLTYTRGSSNENKNKADEWEPKGDLPIEVKENPVQEPAKETPKEEPIKEETPKEEPAEEPAKDSKPADEPLPKTGDDTVAGHDTVVTPSPSKPLKSGQTEELPGKFNDGNSQSGIIAEYTQNYAERGWNQSTNQGALNNAYNKAGRPTDGSLCTTPDGRYMVAVKPRFGNVGDKIDIELENGQVVHAVIADVKGPDAKHEYGHFQGGQVSVVEWESNGTSQDAVRNDLQKNGWWKQDVVAITNLGSGNYF